MLKGCRRRLVVAVTAASLLLPGALPAPALAAGPAPAVAASAAAQNKVTLEQAIRIAKEAYPDVGRFDEFNSDYNEYEGRGVWELRWSKKGEPGGSCNVTISADTGEIIHLNIWQGSPSGRYSGMPAYTRAQAQAVAEKVARGLLPEKFAQCKLVPERPFEEPIIFPLKDRTYPVVYNFTFARTVKGIPVTGNEIRVVVNAETGEMQHFNVNWEDKLDVPDPSGRISADRAAAIFTGQGLELAYAYYGPRDRDTGERPKLVYQVKDGNFILDALTGKVQDPREGPYHLDIGGYGGGGGEPMYSRAKKEEPLSDAEQAAVEKLGRLLTAEQAQAKAEAAYPLPDGMQLTGKRLWQNWEVPGAKAWNFSYSNKEKKRTVEIRVDAATGELLGFSTYENLDPEDYLKKPEVKVSEDQARKLAEEFIKQQQPERAGQVTFRRCNKDIGPWAKFGDESPRAYSLEYARLVNGVVYPANGFNVTVNSTTGEVTNYNMGWWDTSFPAPAGLIDKAKAAALYLEKHPLLLEYARAFERYPDGPDRPKYFLVYHPTGWPMGVLDARTGQELDSEGKPVAGRKAEFTDIAGHPAARDIQLLADQGIVSAEDGRFRPNDRVTGGELLAWLVASADRDGYRPLAKEDDKQLIERARALGIIAAGEDIKAASPVTRLQAARWLVNSQGFGPLARHGEIFNLKAGDAAAVSQADRGYVAAALAMGYLTLQAGGRFGPEGTVTRGEAASMLVRALTAR
ncbi:MAG: PepSY domain-containing protein [Thermoanaerobacterales bacterium]|nr:PepSY domain-containing protein [Thermoanaerobacterales bacterium]